MVIFGETIGAGKRTSLDLQGIGGDGDIGDGGIFGFTGTVRYHGGITCALCGFDGGKCFSKCADLVEFDKYGIGYALRDAFFQDAGIGYENIVARPVARIFQACR